ncbi:alpha/beta hydrolase [Sphaerothrix gracilis]|uniref:alpha/beta hydrolase n=1 Tax=Sphaerothrix gracilis TaxID=3151835 RepID=UPI0031FE288C
MNVGIDREFASAEHSRGHYFGGIKRWLAPSFWGLGAGILQSLAIATPAVSAERIYLTFGLFERAIEIEDLETLANEGELPSDLEYYARFLTPEQLAQLRTVLTEPVDINVITVSQFLHTPQGTFLLQQLGEVINTPARLSGFLPLRAALVLAAADSEEGLTLLNVLRYFPTQGVRIDLLRGLAVAEGIDRAVNEANQAIATIQSTALQAAQQQTLPDIASLPREIQRRGPFALRRVSLTVRRFNPPADLYIPVVSEIASREFPGRFPVVVISHGLGSDRTTFAYLARYLSSYGFVVLAVEHGGSSAEQLLALAEGRTTQVVPDDEFINRPQEVSLALDALTRFARADSYLQRRINLDQVGIIGQSFGGFTALALAGATFNQASLVENCPPQLSSFNVSLLLQCQALALFQPAIAAGDTASARLPETVATFSDPRIKAAIAVNPIGSIIFGPAGLSQVEVPTLLVAGSSDTVAPALAEQIIPFTWLTSAERHLLLLQNGTHFSTVARSENDSEVLPIPVSILGPRPDIAQNYLEAMSTIFFQTYLRQDQRYRPFLSAAYASEISQSPLPLSLVQSLKATERSLLESPEP